jgi:hypothetical protein
MAGDWIKIEHATAGKAEVLKMARMIGINRREMVGLLVDFFIWCDVNCVDGVVDGVVDADVDAVMSCSGFSKVMREVGWLKFNLSPIRMQIINWSHHNGETAKKRALKNKRQERWRSNVDADVDIEASTGASTREEKRRDMSTTDVVDIKRNALLADVDPQIASDWQALRKQKKAAVTQTAVNGIRSEAKKAGLSMQDALVLCCQMGWGGFKAGWVESARAPPATATAKQREAEKFIKEMTGRGRDSGKTIDSTSERIA